MRSTIKIEVDYDNLPVVLVSYQKSDDVRDKLIAIFSQNIFTEGLPGTGLCITQFTASSQDGFNLLIRPLNIKEVQSSRVNSIIAAAKKEYEECVPISGK